mmetsp:Transcript_99397/g.171124  ORF Transcript_99397/g.171124 Transcript_99397/m.171124 type:complete len:480 (-) Transcript_99397:332-1771(-)
MECSAVKLNRNDWLKLEASLTALSCGDGASKMGSAMRSPRPASSSAAASSIVNVLACRRASIRMSASVARKRAASRSLSSCSTRAWLTPWPVELGNGNAASACCSPFTSVQQNCRFSCSWGYSCALAATLALAACSCPSFAASWPGRWQSKALASCRSSSSSELSWRSWSVVACCACNASNSACTFSISCPHCVATSSSWNRTCTGKFCSMDCRWQWVAASWIRVRASISPASSRLKRILVCLSVSHLALTDPIPVAVAWDASCSTRQNTLLVASFCVAACKMLRPRKRCTSSSSSCTRGAQLHRSCSACCSWSRPSRRTCRAITCRTLPIRKEVGDSGSSTTACSSCSSLSSIRFFDSMAADSLWRTCSCSSTLRFFSRACRSRRCRLRASGRARRLATGWAPAAISLNTSAASPAEVLLTTAWMSSTVVPAGTPRSLSAATNAAASNVPPCFALCNAALICRIPRFWIRTASKCASS